METVSFPFAEWALLPETGTDWSISHDLHQPDSILVTGLSLRDASSVRFEQAWSCLSPDEVARGKRYLRDESRNDFVLCRAALRTLLGNWTRQPPSQLRFTYSAYGKPSLVPVEGGPTPRFSVSHSHGMATLAVTSGSHDSLGIDLERRRGDLDGLGLARRFFCPEEAAELAQLSGLTQRQAFFDCWTRKEAVIKALGEGLSCPLDSFKVSVSPGSACRIETLHPAAGPVSRWSLIQLAVGEEFSCSLAIEHPQPRIVCCQFQWDPVD